MSATRFFRPRLFHPAQPLQFPFHPVQRVGHRQVEIAVLLQKLLALLEGHAAFSLKTARPRERAKKHPRPFPQCVAATLQCRRVRLPGTQHRLHVAHQFFYPYIAEADTEIARSNVFQLVRLVEDHRRGFRQTRPRRAPPWPVA